MKRFILAIRCFFSFLFRRPLAAEVAAELAPLLPGAPPPAARLPAGAPANAAPPAASAPPASDGAVEVLALLQREGRLIDFLQEPIDAYGDAQIGAAVRDIHRGCRRVL